MKLPAFLQKFLRSQTWLTHPRDPALASWFAWGSTTASGVSVTPEQAMRLAAVGSCIRVIACSLASLPLTLYKQDGQKKLPDTQHPLYPLLRYQPNDRQTAYDFWMFMVASYLSRGNGYAYIEASRREPVKALIPLVADRVVPFRAPDGSVAYRYTTDKGSQFTYLESEIFRIQDLSVDGISGLSRIDQHRESIGLGMALEEFGARYFSNGTTVGGALELPGKMSPEAYDRLKKSWEERHRGGPNAHKPAILEEGAKWNPFGVAPEQAQFLDSRKLSREEICGMFQVPPHKIGSLDRATFSNIEHQSIEFVMDTLRPIATAIEQAIRRDLLTTSGKETHFAKFNLTALLRGDSTARSNYYKAGLGTTQQPGWMTPNDVRELEDMNPVEGGDELTPLITSVAAPKPADEPASDDPNAARHAGFRVVVPIEVQTPDYTVTKDISFAEDQDGVIRTGKVIETHRALK